MRRHRTATAVVLLAATGTLALPAAAKEGVRAKLTRPVDMQAPAGTTMRVRWRLVDEQGNPFGAGGIYLRVSRCGRRPLRIRATEEAGRGRFSARVKVPAGGMRRLTVGLEGWRTMAGRTERADAIFHFDPPLQSSRRCR